MKTSQHPKKKAIRLSITSEIAFDEDAFQESIYNLLGTLDSETSIGETELMLY